MGAPAYVFCMWNKRLWPAKVLSHQYVSSKCRLSVEIFVLKKQLDVNLADTKPFLKDELQKIGDILGRKRKRTSTGEDHLYEGAVKHAVDMMKLPSLSASRRKGGPCIRAKGGAQGNRELSVKKQEGSDADVSKVVLEISTRYNTGVSPTKGSTIQSSTVSQKESRKKGTKKCPVQRRQPATGKTVQETNTDLQAESPEADKEEGKVPNYMKHPMPDFTGEKGRKRKRTSTGEDHLYEGAVKHAVDMMKLPSLSASRRKGGPCIRAKGGAQGNRELSVKKQEGSDADVSKVVLEISTRYDTGISPTKGSTIQSSTVSQKESRKKGTKKCPVQRRQPATGKTVQETNTDLQAESPEADKEEGKVPNYMKHPMPDFEDDKGISSSGLSMDIGSPEYVSAVFSSQDDTEDVQLPVVMLQKEAAILPGSFAWCKYQHYPYWPSLVKMVDSKHKRATIVFLEQSIYDPTKKKQSFKVALRTIKHYDCPEKQQFLENARKDFGNVIDWCDSLISDYRIRLGCGSFSGSFLDYCTADISLPVRREVKGGKREVMFPEMAKSQQDMFNNNPQLSRKQLPDRSRAARDRANEKLVEFIVNAKEAENHLNDILEGKKKSEWLKKFQSSKRHINCLDTYIEDEQQMELVTGHLQAICVKKGSKTGNLMHGDQTRFIFEVLIPEAVIFAIAATEQMSYKEAEAKYLKGPLVSKRERRLFEEQILEKKRSKLVK
ncbi:PWWP domain-containing DNA repair factor 3A isoform X2 [Phyllobates terribilis]|uniref:PWWP domain-containing DNA repair factor 3A isoform X2 n=1 Tax=Phyllobates terribilis TaxID=111132 RepID=UPI003CCB5151